MRATPQPSGRPVAFVAMCFDVRLETVYHRVIKPTLEDHGFECVRGDELFQTGVIIEQVHEAIEGASLVFCDLTFGNPNVFYELGMAHVLEKPTILISQSAAEIPFDVRHQRVIPYKDDKVGVLDLREVLVETLHKTFPLDQDTPRALPRHQFAEVFSDDLSAQRMALFSSNPEFLRYAVKFLGEQRDRESYQRIRDLAVTSSNPELARDAFTALYRIDPEKSRETLFDSGLLRQPSFLVRERVVSLAAGYPPGDSLVRRMAEQMTDSSWGVRVAVCRVLGQWGSPSAATALRNALSDEQTEVRLAAAEALERIRQIEAARREQAAAAAAAATSPQKETTQ
jgi:hypothetical protein